MRPERAWFGMSLIVLFALIGLTFVGCDGSKGQSTDITYDEQEMETANANARRDVATFIAELSRPTGSGHAVKAPIEHQGETEHIWLTGVSYKNGVFTGAIGNEPEVVGNVRFGQTWTIRESKISDWMYMKNGKMYGNYTIRPLLRSMPKEEAERFRSMLVNP